MRVSDSDPTGSNNDPQDAYFFRANHDGSIQLTKRVSDTETDLDTGTWTPDTSAHWVRLQALGTTIRAKFWADGASEPGTWTLSATDANLASGDAGIVFVNGGSTANRTATFDNLTVTEAT